MTRRYASQLFLTPDGEWMSNAVLELSGNGKIERFFSLSGMHTETAHTLFLDGVISPAPLSLKQHLTQEDIQQISENYFYLNLENEIITPPSKENIKPLLIDFGNTDLLIADNRLVYHLKELSQFSMREVIMAACVRPAQCLREIHPSLPIPEGMILWEDIDFAGDRLTIGTRIRPLL